MGLTWSQFETIGEREPGSPYAHWWLAHLDQGASRGNRTCVMVHACGTLGANGLDIGPAPDGGGWFDAEDSWSSLLGPNDRALPWFVEPDVIVTNRRESHGWSAEDAMALPAGEVAVFGIIDDGIGFANERFRLDDDRTRFDYVWMQGARVSGTASDLPFGRDLVRAEIDEGLTDHDEDWLYREVGLIDMAREAGRSAARRVSHGTAVLDAGAGYAPGDPRAERVVLMGVNLPSRVTQETTGTFLHYFVMLGINRMLGRALWLKQQTNRKRLKVVINFSFALTAGPKDGTTLIDRYLKRTQEQAKERGLDVTFVVPAGNHRQAQVHARLPVPAGGSPEMTWRVQPDDRTASFVEIWLAPGEYRGAPSVTVQLSPPGTGAVSGSAKLPAFGGYVDLTDGESPDLLARAYYLWHPADPCAESGEGREQIVIAIPPTTVEDESTAFGRPGDWRIRLEPIGKREVAADLYVQRDDTLGGGRSRGRQSYFVDTTYEAYDPSGRLKDLDDEDGLVMRAGTVNSFALSPSATVVGARSRFDAKEMPYSGLGPTQILKIVDTLESADETRIHRGVPATGTYSGSRVLLSGTSLAAPAYARTVVEACLPQQTKLFAPPVWDGRRVIRR